MSAPWPIVHPEESLADGGGGFLSQEYEGTSLSQAVFGLSICTPDNSQSCLPLAAPPPLPPKQPKRNKRGRGTRRDSKPPLDDDALPVPSAPAKRSKRPAMPRFASPLPRAGGVGGDVTMSSVSSQPTPPRLVRVGGGLRRIPSELSLGSSAATEDEAPGGRALPFYIAEFTECEEIGKGHFGRVVKVHKRTDDMVYAIKISSTPIKGEQDQRLRSREVAALARCDHPHIVRYYSSWVEDGLLYLQTEFCSKGSAASQPPDFWCDATLVQLLRQVASALAYLHRHKMAHMDIKGENIYLTAHDAFKLGDFGLVASLDPPKPKATALPQGFMAVLSQESCPSQEEGDRKYLALEVLNDQSNLPAADVFSLGISAYELASGQVLPGSGEPWQRLRQGQLDPMPELGTAVVDIIRRMMSPDPTARPSAADVEAACLSLE